MRKVSTRTSLENSVYPYLQIIWTEEADELLRRWDNFENVLEMLKDMVSDHTSLSAATIENARRAIAKAEGKQ